MKIEGNNKKLLLVLLGLLLIGWFYWFQLRPHETRRNCEAFAGSKSSNKSIVNNFYRQCLVKNGMEPESLFVNTQ